MNLNWVDISVFIGFIALVVAFSMYKSRREENSVDYFLAGRGLKWYLIGFSIVAANISTEQFVGMSSQGAVNVGLAVSGYQLLGAITIVFPGIMAAQLYGNQLATADQAYPMLIRNLVPAGLRGFIFAALAGAVISSLASMLNSASTIFTMDLYKRHWRKAASQASLVMIGMALTIVLIILVMIVITWRKPLANAVDMPINSEYDMRPAKSVVWLGSSVIVAVVFFYIIFW